MANLLALCGLINPVIKRVPLSQEVQGKVEGVFQNQADEFFAGISEEIEFGGDWKPDPDELLTIDAPGEMELVSAALDGNILGLPTIDTANFMGERVRSLFLAVGSGGNRRILFQLFAAQQLLSRRFSLLLQGNSFKELTEPAFTLDNSLVAVFEGGKLKFKSFFQLKRVFSLSQFYQEASAQEVEDFCEHSSLYVGNAESFKALADEQTRKLIHAIMKSNVLGQSSVDDILEKANGLGLNLDAQDGKIVMPTDKKDIKKLLRFLDDAIYEAPLSTKRYMTNSKRPLQ